MLGAAGTLGNARTPMEAAQQAYVLAENNKAAWVSRHPVEQRSAEDWQVYDRLCKEVTAG